MKTGLYHDLEQTQCTTADKVTGRFLFSNAGAIPWHTVDSQRNSWNLIRIFPHASQLFLFRPSKGTNYGQQKLR